MGSIERGKDYLLFDGDCGICSFSAEIAKKMDGGRRFIVEPYQFHSETELMKYGVDYHQCSRNLQVITRNGRVYQGAFAVNCFLWHQFPWTVLVLLIYAVPVLLLFEIIGYRLFANNRHLISRWFGMKACLLGRRDYETNEK